MLRRQYSRTAGGLGPRKQVSKHRSEWCRLQKPLSYRVLRQGQCRTQGQLHWTDYKRPSPAESEQPRSWFQQRRHHETSTLRRHEIVKHFAVDGLIQKLCPAIRETHRDAARMKTVRPGRFAFGHGFAGIDRMIAGIRQTEINVTRCTGVVFANAVTEIKLRPPGTAGTPVLVEEQADAAKNFSIRRVAIIDTGRHADLAIAIQIQHGIERIDTSNSINVNPRRRPIASNGVNQRRAAGRQPSVSLLSSSPQDSRPAARLTFSFHSLHVHLLAFPLQKLRLLRQQLLPHPSRIALADVIDVDRIPDHIHGLKVVDKICEVFRRR